MITYNLSFYSRISQNDQNLETTQFVLRDKC